jgi:glycosyltransferase involved in cell wall biosynthesis
MIFATSSLREAYAKRYPCCAARFVTIENGYERGDFPACSQPEPGVRRRRRLVYAGSLYRPTELEVFLAGVALLARRSPDTVERLAIEFIGSVSPGCRAAADAHLADPAVATMVSFVPFLPRLEALRRLAGADAALTLLGPGPGMEVFVGAKLFDAIGLDLQVVAMLPPGEARAVLASLDWGIVADPTPAGVADALARFLEQERPNRPADPGRRYERAALAARLADVLDEVAGTPVSGRDPERPHETDR